MVESASRDNNGAAAEAAAQRRLLLLCDLSNLLAVIVGYGELVRDSLPDGSPTRGDVGVLLRAAERACELCRRLLAP